MSHIKFRNYLRKKKKEEEKILGYDISFQFSFITTCDFIFDKQRPEGSLATPLKRSNYMTKGRKKVTLY